jgi:hypothetical protein
MPVLLPKNAEKGKRPAQVRIAPIPQARTQRPQPVQRCSSMTGAAKPRWLMAPTGQDLSAGQGWFCGQREAWTLILTAFIWLRS